MRITYPQLYIDRKLPKVYIDESQCFEEAGLKGPIEFSKDEAKYAHLAGLQGIGRIVDEGNRMANIENNMSDAIPEIALENTFNEKEFNLDTIPKSRPKIEVDGYLKIQWEMGKINFSKENVLEYKHNQILDRLVDVKI